MIFNLSDPLFDHIFNQQKGVSLVQCIWLIQHICINLIYFCDSMCKIDQELKIGLLEEILQEYFESAALVIGKIGFTAQKLAVPLRLLLGSGK